MDVDKELPSTYNGDPTKITKILSNLLVTSIKYTSKGNIILHVKKIVDSSKTIIQYYIETKGSYIDQYDVLNFFNNNEINNNGFNSYTLGLNVAKLYSEMIDGRISFKSNNGRDFSYIFEIEPLINNIMPVGDISSLFTKNEDIRDINLQGKTILVVDDNSLNLKLLSRMLSEYGCSVDQANSGLECIDMVQSKQYDLIFLDHMMPDMDGIHTLYNLKQRASGFDTPVVVLTANAIEGSKEMYLREGFVDYLSKPIDQVELDRVLREQLGIEDDEEEKLIVNNS
jgi:CheY-like chemotaxis protein